MKKFIVYILIAITISITLIGTTAYADTSQKNTITKSFLIAGNDFIEPLIPKPGLLPGPDPDRQKEEGGARSILIDTILPFFAIGLVSFVGGMSLIFLIIAGVRFSVSYGNDEDIQKAKDQATYALIGLVLALLSYTIVKIVTNIKFTKESDIKTTTYIETTHIS